MSLFFFDIHDGIVARDIVGQELLDIAAARAWAMQVASAYAFRVGEVNGVAVVTVRDGPDRTLLKVRLIFDVEEIQPQAETLGIR